MESQKSSAFLPKAFRWLFLILEVLGVIAVVVGLFLALVDPHISANAHFGPLHTNILGQGAEFELAPAAPVQGADGTNAATPAAPTFNVTLFNGTVAMKVKDPAGFIDILRTYALPLAIIHALFAVALFDILRRLFRNVSRGESFAPQTVRLVQWIGGGLIVFSFVAAIGESVLRHEVISFLLAHGQVAVGGAPLQLPHHPGLHDTWVGHMLPFGHGAFWFGLLVLALAEVFRQGLALKRDNELTV